MTMTTVTIYTDGACSGNPGPGGWAAVLSAGQHRKEVAGGKPHTTNNAMEPTAVCEALKALKQRGLSVTIYTDSMLVINLLTNGHRAKKPHLAALVCEIKELVAARHLAVDWFHVNGHAGWAVRTFRLDHFTRLARGEKHSGDDPAVLNTKGGQVIVYPADWRLVQARPQKASEAALDKFLASGWATAPFAGVIEPPQPQ